MEISIHVPAWGTTETDIIWKIWYSNFNPRSRVGNDRYISIGRCFVFRFQSTFPRGERLSFSCPHLSLSTISIHVPAWGTTEIQSLFFGKFSISIHVPAWGTTFPEMCCFKQNKNFNPRSRVGNDLDDLQHLGLHFTISIHVPAWGTTILYLLMMLCIVFQSTFPRGERREETLSDKLATGFQSTFPRGERLYRTVYITVYSKISIHVPAWGTTL